jgi:KUP system potassium uptake protein
MFSFTVLTTWRRGRQLLAQVMCRQRIPLETFLDSIDDVHRIQGTAIFMTSARDGVPSALLHNLKHNQVLHERVALVTVETVNTPTVHETDRISVRHLSKGFLRIFIRYGFMESPDIPGALAKCERFGDTLDLMQTTFFLSRETIVPSTHRHMMPIRARLFALMSRNATSATEFFKIPTGRVVELGTQVML